MSVLQKLNALLATGEWTQASLAQRLGVSQSTINRWKQGTSPEGDHRDALAALYAEVNGLSPENNMMRIEWQVGSGQRLFLVSGADQGWTERPPSAARKLEAMRVKGDVMQPFFSNGWLLFHGDPCPPESLIGEIVVALLPDGMRIVRQLRHGSGPDRWTLSIPSASDMVDVELRRVFPLEWIKPQTNAPAPI